MPPPTVPRGIIGPGLSMLMPLNLVGDDPNAMTNLRFLTTYEN